MNIRNHELIRLPQSTNSRKW